MIWNPDFALFYLYTLLLFGALLLWAVPALVRSLLTALQGVLPGSTSSNPPRSWAMVRKTLAGSLEGRPLASQRGPD